MSLKRKVALSGLSLLCLLMTQPVHKALTAEAVAIEKSNTTQLAQQDTTAEIIRLFEEGTRLMQVGDEASLRQAINVWSQVIPLVQSVNEVIGEAAALNNLGGIYNRLGDYATALSYYQLSLPLSQRSGNQHGEASTLNNMGVIYGSIGELDTALTYLQQALLLRRAINDRQGEAITLYGLAFTYEELGDGDRAIEYYEQSVPLFKAVGDSQGESDAIARIAGIKDPSNPARTSSGAVIY